MTVERTSPNIGDYARITQALNPLEFEIPITQQQSDYFPDFLEQRINRYTDYFKTYLKPNTDDLTNYTDGATDVLTNKITALGSGLIKAVQCYYEGEILKATEVFNKTLNDLDHAGISLYEHISENENFYRTRPSADKRLKRPDLFHNPYQNRNIVATSRYSIPGLPALYLGNSVYVCWEEYDRRNINQLYFSRFSNQKKLKVIKIYRLDDLQKDLGPVHPLLQNTYLLRYMALFPLFIACSVRTKEAGTFKPEYIIPQLLLQYITQDEEVDGIMFPSTKVDYTKIDGVGAYNYVFPVKKTAKAGFCSDLVTNFQMTEPTSIELETLLSYANPVIRDSSFVNPIPGNLSLFEGENHLYLRTAFGRLEETLLKRPLAPVE